MRLSQLKSLLEEIEEAVEEDAEIYLASQPGYPLKYSIRGIWANDEGEVYIVEGEQLAYLSSDDSRAFEEYID